MQGEARKRQRFYFREGLAMLQTGSCSSGSADVMRCSAHIIKYTAMVFITLLAAVAATEGAAVSVGPGESIQAAIDEARPGDSITVEAGAYRESLNISKPLTIQAAAGASRPLLDGGSSGSAMILRAEGISVSGFDIGTARGTGVRVVADGCIMENNTISGCLNGILLDSSRGSLIVRNDINNNTNGITLYGCSGNTIAGNSIKDNNINDEGDCGIFLARSGDNLILNNDLQDNGDTSISLRTSANNTIKGNRIADNDWYGICLAQSSSQNLIEGNHATGNRNSGIYLDSSRDNVLLGNRAEDNPRGIYLTYDSNDNLLQENNLSFNGKGVQLAGHSSNNTIENNTAKENGYGIYLSFSSGWNLIFSNHLIDNDCNAYDMGQSNRWDNSLVGNYYSDLGKIFYIPGGAGVDRHPMTEP